MIGEWSLADAGIYHDILLYWVIVHSETMSLLAALYSGVHLPGMAIFLIASVVSNLFLVNTFSRLDPSVSKFLVYNTISFNLCGY
jgi:hypothetical protein